MSPSNWLILYFFIQTLLFNYSLYIFFEIIQKSKKLDNVNKSFFNFWSF
uniref:ATP synthase F0 subunit 8 n=1 Tax=Liposcelis sculptilimacula TaxID=1899352 RepID=A0A191ZS81_9NEOP|nr:ATP synthase F0 subunit 8 [Liposcelis keleri]ANJ70947.1 ATP synthase F0 subunit 8 [Liposcelis sculptilimacula]